MLNIILKNILLSLISLCCISNMNGQIPHYIIVKADSILLEKVDAKSFKSISLNCLESGPYIGNSIWSNCNSSSIKKEKKPIEYYYLEYTFLLFSSNSYSFSMKLDSLGNLYKNYEIKLPNCNKYPELCVGLINEEKAIAIADSANFDKGLKKWDVTLFFYERTRRFSWKIKNYKKIESLSQNCIDSSGELLIMDCNNGKIEEVLDWQKTCVN